MLSLFCKKSKETKVTELEALSALNVPAEVISDLCKVAYSRGISVSGLVIARLSFNKEAI